MSKMNRNLAQQESYPSAVVYGNNCLHIVVQGVKGGEGPCQIEHLVRRGNDSFQLNLWKSIISVPYKRNHFLAVSLRNLVCAYHRPVCTVSLA